MFRSTNLLRIFGASAMNLHDMVEMPGQFTVRGGIVDVFPAEAERPVRLELFGDSVESLREFDPNTQRSVRPIERVTLPPLAGTIQSNGFRFGNGDSAGPEDAPRAHSLFDLHEDTVVLLDEPEAIEEASRAVSGKRGGKFRSAGNDSAGGRVLVFFHRGLGSAALRATRAWNSNTSA